MNADYRYLPFYLPGKAREKELPEPRAIARNTDPPESHAAAAKVRTTRGQAIVLEAIRQLGAVTDERLVRHLAGVLSDSGVRGRRHELAEKGLVKVVGKSLTKHGNECSIWSVNDDIRS